MKTLWQRANEIIPGGNHLFSKTPDRYAPGAWPAYYVNAKGINVYTEEKGYLDFSVMGAGNSTLGYADEDVDTAVIEAILSGNVSTLNCPEEVELAEVMLKLNPKMDMVRFGRSGNDACQIALRIAREYSGKRKYAICGYHGWEIGHPPQLDPECVPFEYGESNRARDIITWLDLDEDPYDNNGGGGCACVMMECVRNKPVDIDFLRKIREITADKNIPLIFDEVASGFRCNLGGYHQTIGIYPDIVTYGKAMGNGHAISAVVGTEEIMKSALNTFISSMQWSERSGYAAGLATIEKMRKVNAQQRMMEAGAVVKKVWQVVANDVGLNVEVSGLDPLATWAFKGDDDRRLLTTFTQEMLKRGYLAAGQFYPSVCHTPTEIEAYSDNVFEAFADITSGKATLEGEPARAGFRRLV